MQIVYCEYVNKNERKQIDTDKIREWDRETNEVTRSVQIWKKYVKQMRQTKRKWIIKGIQSQSISMEIEIKMDRMFHSPLKYQNDLRTVVCVCVFCFK